MRFFGLSCFVYYETQGNTAQNANRLRSKPEFS
nr:MAG TPA: hypothetical protein [Caudoviricetes sp.]